MGVEYDSMGMGTKEVGWKLNRRRKEGGGRGKRLPEVGKKYKRRVLATRERVSVCMLTILVDGQLLFLGWPLCK